MEAASLHYEVKPGVLHRIVEGEAVMLDLETGEYYGLNLVGAHIWHMLAQGCSLSHICASVSKNFETAGVELQADVESFVEALERKGLVRQNGANGAGH